jgi:hypothetical protein
VAPPRTVNDAEGVSESNKENQVKTQRHEEGAGEMMMLRYGGLGKGGEQWD